MRLIQINVGKDELNIYKNKRSLIKEMKQKAEPCLKNFFTIHVPVSITTDRFKKKNEAEQKGNPLMNKKLQRKTDSHIEIVYSQKSAKSFGKRKKLQAIPLLSNLKYHSESKLRVVKDLKKTQYNFVFEKNMVQSPLVKQENEVESGRPIKTSHSSKSFYRRNLPSQSTRRDSIGGTKSNLRGDYGEGKFSKTLFQFTGLQKFQKCQNINKFKKWEERIQISPKKSSKPQFEQFEQAKHLRANIFISH